MIQLNLSNIMGVIVRTVTQAWKMYDVQSAPNRAAPPPDTQIFSAQIPQNIRHKIAKNPQELGTKNRNTKIPPPSLLSRSRPIP